ncbi:hypothetical protein R1flu_002634 [Riccia fluitans]|uniref:Uncharacterized protein n=1 Tax=Riccia fluitans TaxID=41844 RepID=A0ABD1YAH4_9MARC
MDGWNIAIDFGASSFFSQFGAALDASCGWQRSYGDDVNESQFNQNTRTVPSSQAPSSIEFSQILEDDNFDINCVHPATRTDRWQDILESFYGNRPSVTPQCMAESMLGALSFDRRNLPIDDGGFDSTIDPTVQSNFGKRRKKDMSKSATAIFNAMDQFTSSISDVERFERDARRDEQEDRQNQFIEEVERKRQEFLERQHTDMVDVFRTMANAFMMIATRNPESNL